VVLAACLHPAVLNPLLRRTLRLARRAPLDHDLSWHGILLASGWAVLSWLVFGVHLWLLVRDLGGTGEVFITAVGAFPLAWTVGFLIVIAPAGVGPREIALAAALAPVLGAGEVLLVVIASRLMFTVADVVWAGVGYALGRRHRLSQEELAAAETLRRGTAGTSP
jgi:uncharacterized membrane protein YbhN (UPF0104 family)